MPVCGPITGRVRGEVGHQVHVADDEAVVREEVAEQLLVLELQTKAREDYVKFYNHGKSLYKGLLLLALSYLRHC